jgi:hypothetical protein
MNLSDYQLEPLPINTPTILCDAVGYPGQSRFVAFYWTPDGDELMFTDGHISADGNWYVWLTFLQHPAVAVHLGQYDFGSSDNEAKYWLLLDRETNRIYAGTPGEVCKLLVQQIPATPVSDEQSSGIIEEVTFENLDAFQWREVQGPSQDEIKSEMRRRTALIDELSRQLDALNS